MYSITMTCMTRVMYISGLGMFDKDEKLQTDLPLALESV